MWTPEWHIDDSHANLHETATRKASVHTLLARMCVPLQRVEPSGVDYTRKLS